MTPPSLTSSLNAALALVRRALDLVDDLTAERINAALDEQSGIAWDSEFDRQAEGRRISNENALKLVDGHLKMLGLIEAAPAAAPLRGGVAVARADLVTARGQIQRDMT